MSQQYHTRIWKESLKNLQDILEDDRKLTNEGPYKDKDEVKQKIGDLYLRYAVLSNKLCEAAEEMRDPLIAAYVRKYYEITVSRVLQLGQEHCRLLAEDATDLDCQLIKMALTPFDVRLKIPGYYLRQRDEEIKKRQKYLDRKPEGQDGEPEKPAKSETEREKLFLQKNHEIQKQCKKDYEEKCRDAEEQVRLLYKLRIEENIEDELREWCENFYKTCGEFPPFPTSKLEFLAGKTFGIPKGLEKLSNTNIEFELPKSMFIRDFCGFQKLGGSALIPAGYWVTPEEWIACQKNTKRKIDKKKTVKKRVKKRPSQGFQLLPTEFFKIVQSLRDTNCTPISEEGIESEAFYKIGMEIRKDVDETFRAELDLLQDALYKDKFPKGKRRKRAGRKTKKIKRRKALDTEKCIEELLKTGVLREGYGSRLEDFMSDFDYTGKTFNGKLVDLLLQRCILPLSSLAVHQLSPLTRSICLTGPEHTAKEFLIDAVVTATGAAEFDISCEVTSVYNKNELKRLIAAVKHLSRQLQPSIMFINNIERLFYKKVAAKDRPLKPKQLGPFIRKLVRGIKHSDQILLMATASQPWLARRAKLMKCIDRFFHVPTTHYGSHVLYWRAFLPNNAAVPVLAKISSSQGLRYNELGETASSENIIDQLVTKQAVNQKKFDNFIKHTQLNVGKKNKKGK